MRRHIVFTTAALFVLVLAAVYVSAQGLGGPPPGRAAEFEGYWMGVDHVDGGDSRRSLVRAADGRFVLAARDSVLSLCDGTDRGYASFDDGEMTGPDVMESSALTIECFNNGATVVLNARFELLARGRMVETVTMLDGTPVSTIVFHKVSVDWR